ncbi:MAG: glycosyltransferase [Cyclobacteriaceae bacterium]
MSLVSVCLPMYNGEKYLRQSLDSIVNQSYQNLEILVVDDCSTDNGPSIIGEYQRKDSRIRLIRNERNLGLVGNWNKCISEASGEFVKLQFQDDMMMNDTIEKMMMMAEKEGVNVVLTDREYTYENDINVFYEEELPRLSDHFKQNAVIKPAFITDLLLSIGTNHNFMGEPIIGLVRKEVFDSWGLYDDAFKQIGDFEFWIRLGLNENVGFIPERLNIFRVHDDSETVRNARAPEINPSHLDRIHLASKMHSGKEYEKFRETAGEEFTEDALRTYVNTYTKVHGRDKLSAFIDEGFFQYLDPEKTFWNRLVGAFR